MLTSPEQFTSSDFLSVLIFGGGGIFLFYAVPFIMFAYFYMQFRGNAGDITIEGLVFRYIFYSMASIIAGGLVFSLLSALSFSNVSNATSGLYYFFTINWDDFNSVATAIQNNGNLLSTEKNNIKFLALLLMVIKIMFKTLAVMPIVVLLYLTFVSTMKCKKIAISGETSLDNCIMKKLFYILLFIMSLSIVYEFADATLSYLFENYLNVTLNSNYGIYHTAVEMFKQIRKDVGEYYLNVNHEGFFGTVFNTIKSLF